MFDLSTDGETFPDAQTELRVLRVRIQLAMAWSSMILKAFDAHVHYGINYKDLHEYQDTTLIEEGMGLNLVAGQEKFMEYMRRIEHGLNAAIRRKQFILHNRRPQLT